MLGATTDGTTVPTQPSTQSLKVREAIQAALDLDVINDRVNEGKGRIYGMEVTHIREIVRAQEVTPLPRAPVLIEGVIDLRGAVVPVIDLQARFGRSMATIGSKTCIVIFDAVRDGERMEIGLLVDAVSEVIDIAAGQVEPPPNFGASIRRDFIRGMGKVNGNRFVIILEPDRAFDMSEMARLCEAAQEAAV